MRSMIWAMALAVTGAWAQDINFDVSPREIGINELVRLTIVIDGDYNGRAPTFDRGLRLGDFELVNRTPSQSQQTTIVNGRVTSNVSFTYTLRPTKKGKLILPSQEITYQGKKIKSEPVEITVGDEVRSVGRRGSRDPFDGFRNRRRRSNEPAEVFATMEIPKKTYYLGEPIPLEVKIYRTMGVQISNRGSSMSLPDFLEFWVEEVEHQSNEGLVTRDGKEYAVFTVAKRRLFPNKSGKINIPPAEFTLSVTTETGFFADWQQVNRNTEGVQLDILPLPEQNKPEDFSGLVGSFSMTGSLDKTEVKVGDSVNLEIQVAGQGNFSALNELDFEGIPDFETFSGGSPQVEDLGGGSFRKTWIFALVPKREGSYQVPLPSLSYFDLGRKTYRRAPAENLPLRVLPGQGLGAPLHGGEERGITATRNLNFIKIGELGETDTRARLPEPSRITYAAAAFVLLDLLVFLGLFFHRHGLSKRANYRPKFALRNFSKKISSLSSKDSDAFHGGLSEAVLDYFGDKWERTGQGISLDTIRDRLHREGVDDELYDQVQECVEACDLARFTPSSSSSREQLLTKTRETIERVEAALS